MEQIEIKATSSDLELSRDVEEMVTLEHYFVYCHAWELARTFSLGEGKFWGISRDQRP